MQRNIVRLARYLSAVIPRAGATRDACYAACITLVAFFAYERLHLGTNLFRFVADHPGYEFGDLLLGVLTLGAVALVFLVRRWRELRHEISTHKATEIAATCAEALLRDAIDSISEAIVIYDHQDRLVLVNASYREMFPERAARLVLGMTFEEVIRSFLAEGEFPEALGKESEWLAERVQQHHDSQGEHTRRLRDGRWILVSERRMRSGGRAALLVDITALKRAQQALQESEYRIHDFASTSSDWFWEQDADLCFTMVGPGAMVGAENAQLYLGKRRWDLADTRHDPIGWQRHQLDVVAHKPFRDFRYQLPGAEGRPRYASVSGVPVFDAAGAFIGYRGTGREITSQVEAENELRAAKERAEQAEELLHDAVDSISEGFVIYDRDDRLVLCNDGYRKVYPESAERMVPGIAFEDLLRHGLAFGGYPDAVGREETWLAERLAQHRAATDEFEQQRGDGKWVLATDRRMRSGGIAGLRINITALKQTQAALRDSEEHLDRAQEIAGLGSWEFDIPTNRFIWSKNMYRLRGLSPETFEPTAETVPNYVHPDDDPLARQHRNDLEAGIRRDPIDLRFVRPTGEIRVMRVDGRPIVDADGVIRRLSGTMQDITERLMIEQQLAQAQKMEALGNLTGGMAHDFNNVLGVIIGNLELQGRSLSINDLTEELRAEALAGALRGAELTRRLLAFARRQPLHPELTDVNALVESITKLFDRVLGEDIQLNLQLDPTLWKIIIDPAQLEAALTNLATNARDAMPRGGRLDIATRNIHIEATDAGQYPEIAPGDYVVIDVSDTGVGIAPEALARIFEPFFTTKEPGRGTGLGLSMVFGFVKQSGGHVTAYSELDRGSAFLLYLPRARTNELAPAQHPKQADATGGYETILVVEDNAPLRRATMRQLAALGYHVVPAEDGSEALTILSSNRRVDLLFTDVVMPGVIDGLDLAECASQLRPGIKVLLTSGFPDRRGAEQRLATPRHRLLSKPYRQEELAQAIREALDRGTVAPSS